MSVNEEKAPRTSVFEKIAPILVVLSIGLAFMVGVLWQKVNNLEKGGTTATTNTGGQPNQPVVSLDTIKGLFDKNLVKFGGKDRKVLFVEVADPSCPYCHVATGLNSTLNNQMDLHSGTRKRRNGIKGTLLCPRCRQILGSPRSTLYKCWV